MEFQASRITIFGYGSLMDVVSCRMTLPSAVNFRKGILNGFSRSYNLVSISSIRTRAVDSLSLELAALSIRPQENSIVLGCLFEIGASELSPYLEREHRYKAVQVEVQDGVSVVRAYTVVAQTDEEYRNSMSEEEYYNRVGQYYTGSLWGRTDILPLRKYMLRVIDAAVLLGGEEYRDNMLDETLLADNVTTLRQYVDRLKLHTSCL